MDCHDFSVMLSNEITVWRFETVREDGRQWGCGAL